MQNDLSDSRPAMARDSFLPPLFFCGSEDITKQGKDDTQSESALWLQSASAQVRRFNQYTIAGYHQPIRIKLSHLPRQTPNLALPDCIYSILLYSLPNFSSAEWKIRLETTTYWNNKRTSRPRTGNVVQKWGVRSACSRDWLYPTQYEPFDRQRIFQPVDGRCFERADHQLRRFVR